MTAESIRESRGVGPDGRTEHTSSSAGESGQKTVIVNMRTAVPPLANQPRVHEGEMRMRSLALATGLLIFTAMAAMGQATPGIDVARGDVSLTYHWVRTNTQPGECGCFGLNGGGVSASWNLNPRWAMVAELSGEYAGSGPSSGNSLTLISYLAGARYRVPQPWLRGPHALQPFAQVLLGAAHSGGGLAGAGDGTMEFATRTGGGIDLPVNSRIAIRVVQIDYDLTEFRNTVNDHQNNLLLEAGFVFHWSR